MSLVDSNNLHNAKSLRSAAQACSTYEKGYRLAMEGLNSAIAQLEQLNHTTRNLEVKVVEKG